ncbi:MAG: ImmA/IrrE family metallo-endopeptidase [Thermoguttaceae bacterium]|nr:ImmA/IrrE family metallo-endopeptidase [Thermoguttaceae bacterium]
MGFKKRIINNKIDFPEIEKPELIDSPSRLLLFAKNQGITCVPLDLNSLCKKLNINIVYQSLFQLPEIQRSEIQRSEIQRSDKNNISGILFRNFDGSWTISVNENHHINRQRFTIAHELGHYFLHRHEGSVFTDEIFFRSMYFGNEKKQKMEWQANEFAATILMPRQEIVKLISNGIVDIESLARTFQVSTLAMRFQLERTQLLNDNKVNYVYSDIKN